MKYLISLGIALCFFTTCVQPIHKGYDKLPPGIWRGVLLLDQDKPMIDQNSKITLDYKTSKIPFNFEVKYNTNNSISIHFINGSERIICNDIIYNRDKATAKDTLKIDFTEFGTYITAVFEENKMEGHWHVPFKNNYTIPFKAKFGENYRFSPTNSRANQNISGKWDVIFNPESTDQYPAIGEFDQINNSLTGTFLTETGDYRYLDGQIEENKFYLSCFDGAHAFLFHGKIQSDSTIIGLFRSGKSYKSSWSATKNDFAKLTDPYSLTKIQNQENELNFSFPNLDGQAVSLNDQKFKDKIKLVKISGSWCPNCKDETIFLKEYFGKNPSDKIEIIEIGFERYKDDSKNILQLTKYKSALNIPYTILYGGFASKKEASIHFPQLNNIISWPTLVFVDKYNKIQHVHTGFSGPATSQYPIFKIKFDSIINAMIDNY